MNSNILNGCLFCGAVSGKVKKGIISETEYSIAMVSGHQFEPCEIWVVLKRHAENIFDLKVVYD